MELVGTGLVFTDEEGTQTTIDLCPLVKTCETLTSLVISGTGLLFWDEEGTSNFLDLPYTPTNPGDWSGSPITIAEAIDRIANMIANGLTGIIV